MILSILLTDGPLSPMYKALIESGIGYEYTANGYDSNTLQATFGIGISGVHENEISKIPEIIENIFRQVCSDGFEHDRVEAILHQIELSQKTVSTSFGMNLIHRIARYWTCHADPLPPLEINTLLAELKERLREGGYFEGLIKKYLLDNTHKVTLKMEPDAEYAVKLLEREEKRLKEIEKNLTEEEKKKIISDSVALSLSQAKEEDASCLPSLSRSDIALEIEPVNFSPPQHIKCGGFVGEREREKQNEKQSKKKQATKTAQKQIDLYSLEQPTNGIGYVRGLVDLTTDVPESLLRYLPIYTQIFGEMGAGSLSYADLSHDIQMYTGGIAASTEILSGFHGLNRGGEGERGGESVRERENDYNVYLSVGSSSLERNSEKMLSLLSDCLSLPHLDNTERLHVLLNQMVKNYVGSVQTSSHSYAVRYAMSSLSPQYSLMENLDGLSYMKYLTSLSSTENTKQMLERVSAGLQELSKLIRSRGFSRLMVTGDEYTSNRVSESLDSLLLEPVLENGYKPLVKLEGLPTNFESNIGEIGNESDQIGNRTFLSFPLQVNAVALCAKSAPLDHPDIAKLRVLSVLLSNNYLHKEVRERGGAYGASMSVRRDGTLSLFSYRDPNTVDTVETFLNVSKHLENNPVKDSEIGML